MEFTQTVEAKAKTMTPKDWVKVGMKALGIVTAIDVAREVGSKTTPFTGVVCGVAVGDMMLRSTDTMVDSLAAAKDKFFGPGYFTKVPGEDLSDEASEPAPVDVMTKTTNYGENGEG